MIELGSASVIAAFFIPPARQPSSALEPEPRTFAVVTVPDLLISSQYRAELFAAGAPVMQSDTVFSSPLSAPSSRLLGSFMPSAPSSNTRYAGVGSAAARTGQTAEIAAITARRMNV